MHCTDKCINRRLNMEKMMLGRQSAQLIAQWLITEAISISHLLLAENNLCDEGVNELKYALASSKTLVVVDLAMNNLTQKAAPYLRHILALNQSIYTLNLGSFPGA